MALEEGGRYITVKLAKVNISSDVVENHVFYFWAQLTKILWIQEKSYEERLELLEKEVVLTGITDNLIMPSWQRHKNSGTCLGGNTGGKQEDLENFLANFNITDHKERQ